MLLTKRRFIFTILFFCFHANLEAAPVCASDKSVCMEVVSWANKQGFDFWAAVHRPCATTISLKHRGRNLDLNESSANTFAFDKPGKRKLFSKEILQKGQPWNFDYTFYSQCGLVTATHDNSYLYSIPVIQSNGVLVSQAFHGPFSHFGAANQYAVDFSVPEDTPIYAARDGVVVQVVQHFTLGGRDIPENNVNVVRVQHVDFTVAEYAHLRPNGAVVKEGQRVERGELIAYSGNTGKSTGPHLHFAVHVPIDGKYRRSIPISFATGDGHELKQGNRYTSTLNEIKPQSGLPTF